MEGSLKKGLLRTPLMCTCKGHTGTTPGQRCSEGVAAKATPQSPPVSKARPAEVPSANTFSVLQIPKTPPMEPQRPSLFQLAIERRMRVPLIGCGKCETCDRIRRQYVYGCQCKECEECLKIQRYVLEEPPPKKSRSILEP